MTIGDRLLLRDEGVIEMAEELHSTTRVFVKLDSQCHQLKNLLQDAREYLDVFLQLYCMETGEPVSVYWSGGGASISEGLPFGRAKSMPPSWTSDREKAFPFETRRMSPEAERRIRSGLEEVERRLSAYRYWPLQDKPSVKLALGYFQTSLIEAEMSKDRALVDLIVAAEALLSGPSFRLGQRMAALCGDGDDERESIEERFRELYDKRNKLVHGGSPEKAEVTPKDIEDLKKIVQIALKRVLHLREYSRDDLRDLLDGSLLSNSSRKILAEKLRSSWRQT